LRLHDGRPLSETAIAARQTKRSINLSQLISSILNGRKFSRPFSLAPFPLSFSSTYTSPPIGHSNPDKSGPIILDAAPGAGTEIGIIADYCQF
jgi:hypothetical protein